MYLPNPDLRPTGAEAAEFIDVPPAREQSVAGTGRLDLQTRANIARWAEEYIAGLVDNHNGTPDDVRRIIHQLHDQQVAADDLR